jgi:PAS domain S-box-containing protein
MATPLRVLFVEDSDDDTQLMIREIRRGGYDIEWERIETRAAMQVALAGQPWDLVISDHTMPQFSSMQALEVLKNSGQDLPFIIISGSIGEDAAVSALKTGANDFLIKGNWARLIPAIQRELREAETRRERKKAVEALRAAEARLSGILELAADAVIVINEYQHIILFNKSAAHIFRYEAGEVIDQPLDILLPSRFAIIHQEHVNAFRAAPESARRMGERLEIFGRRKDGREFPAEASISKLEQGGESTFTVILRDITERKRAEAALRESDARFRSLFENTPVAIWEEDFSEVKNNLDRLEIKDVFELETSLNDHPEFVEECISLVKIIDVNQAALSLHKATDKKELFEGLKKTFVPESLLAFKQELITIATGESQLELDEVMQTLEGTRLDVTLKWAVAVGHEKTYSRVLVSLVDITERKQRERELEAIATTNSTLRAAKTLDELLSRLLDQALTLVTAEAGSIWLHDSSSDTINLAAHLGWETANIITSVKPGEDVPGLVVKHGETIVSREFHSDPRVIAENRKRIPIGIGGVCLPLRAEERVVGAMFINVQLPREITNNEVRVLHALAEIGGNAIHRLRLYEHTIRQLERLDALRKIDLAISSSFDLRVSLNIVLEQVLRQLEVDAAAVLVMIPDTGRLEFAEGRGFLTRHIDTTSLHLGEDYAGQAALEQRVIHIGNLAGNSDRPARQKMLTDEGFLSYFGVPLIAKGKVNGVLEIFHRSPLNPNMEWLNFLDSLGWQTAVAIDNANLFETLQRSNIELEHRVAERTNELNRANTELERANRAKDEFLASMSHELRTPLNSILGLSESLLEQRRGPLNEHQQKSLQIIESSGAHLLELINDVLDLSKIEAGMLEYYPQVVEVDTLCRSSLAFVKEQALRKSLDLNYEADQAVSKIYADPRRLKQILVNLLSNAVKFTPNNGRVTLQVYADTEQDLIQLSIIDNGVGIAPEDLKQLFQPFVQVDSRLNRQFEGTGLGLALVQKLTDLHGGSIQVESEIGKGSRFTINLPWGKKMVAQQEIMESGSVLLTHEKSGKSDVPSKKASGHGVVLLAEDNTANTLTIGEYLKSHDYTIINAHNGLEAIQRAEETIPDIILMDIQMPVMDGLEAMRRLRENPRFQSTPIIALTALAMPGDRERCLEAGANEYMRKPVGLKKLLYTINNFLGGGNK